MDRLRCCVERLLPRLSLEKYGLAVCTVDMWYSRCSVRLVSVLSFLVSQAAVVLLAVAARLLEVGAMGH